MACGSYAAKDWPTTAPLAARYCYGAVKKTLLTTPDALPPGTIRLVETGSGAYKPRVGEPPLIKLE